MAIVSTIDSVRDWIESEICSKVEFKLPDNDAVDEDYPFKLVHPAAFAMFMPTKDKLPDGVEESVPSVTIRIENGTDLIANGTREMKVTLLFATWSTGLHAGDYLSSVAYERDGNGNIVNVVATKKYDSGEKIFKPDAEGWRDAWNFVDVAVREIENTEYLGGFRFVKEKGLNFGPVATQEATPDFYPLWFATVDFYISEILRVERKHTLYGEYL